MGLHAHTDSPAAGAPTFEELLPHRRPMLLLAEVVSRDGERCRARCWPSLCCPFLRPDGLVDPSLAIELVAQAAALLGPPRGEGEPSSGLVVGLQSFELGEAVSAEVELEVEARLRTASRVFRELEGEVRAGGRVLGGGLVRLVAGAAADHRCTAPALGPRLTAAASVPAAPSFPVPLHDIVEQDGVLRAEVELPPDLPLFQGHFPGRPILPAAAAVALAAALPLAARTGRRLTRIEKARFGRALVPGTTVRLRASRAGFPSVHRVVLETSEGVAATVDLSLWPGAGTEG